MIQECHSNMINLIHLTILTLLLFWKKVLAVVLVLSMPLQQSYRYYINPRTIRGCTSCRFGVLLIQLTLWVILTFQKMKF